MTNPQCQSRPFESSRPLYGDLKNDALFKALFGSEEKKNSLIYFINSLMGFEGDAEILEVSFDPTILLPLQPENKLGIVDVLCTDQRGQKFIVEMQIVRQDFFIQRALYYICHVYAKQLKTAEDYGEAHPVYLLAILDFEMRDGFEGVKREIHLKDQNNVIVTQHLNMTFVSLPQFKRTRVEELDNAFEEWCYILKQNTLTQEDAVKLIEADPKIWEAVQTMESSHWTPEQWAAYEARRMYLSDITSFNNYILRMQKWNEELGLKESEVEKKAGEVERKESEVEKKAGEIERKENEVERSLLKAAQVLLDVGQSMETVAKTLDISVSKLQELQSKFHEK